MSDFKANLLSLADEMDKTIIECQNIHGRYARDDMSVPYIIEYELNRRDVGEEPRLLREAATFIELQAAENVKLNARMIITDDIVERASEAYGRYFKGIEKQPHIRMLPPNSRELNSMRAALEAIFGN